ncbi:sulfatase [Pontiella sulfatireligans]|uniref:Arylsulfatase n=1 Tax=Pontiella sulfatireligans TaxID=2750658 RepID=A0A6C2UT34_9BACT|nr:sulfatase [Pontiella sulfatireligans]SPS74544.1 sulfatase S1_16 [Kiritimatiellales bacterium]VGO23123.1 Arylsulfatase [Pontiella sulfatireligans]
MISRILIALCMVVSSAYAKPNIIYINADDLGVMDVGFNSDRYYTPNIDRLRAEGMLFTDAYAPAANCAPSRACVLSGQLGPRHGVYTVGASERGMPQQRKLIPIKNIEHLELDNLTIAGALKADGYKTIHLGKWHVGNDPLQQGCDVNIGGDETGSPHGGYYSPFKKGSMTPYNDLYPAGTHRVDIFADQAIKFMRANKDQPFFMHMAYYSVHSGLELVPEFEARYQDEDVNLKYATMISKMDQGIGKIMDELDALGLADDTLVLFCSDNGGICATSMQTPYRAGKGSYFEGGTRVPLLVRWPVKVKPSSTCKVPVVGIDFYPTFLEIAGVDKPQGKVLDGESLVPLLTQSGSFPERTLFWHFPIYLQKYAGKADDSHDVLFRTRPGSTLRQGNWKLHEYFEDGTIELYDLESDLGERTNVAAEHPEKTAELHRLLKQWRAEMNAAVPTAKNPAFDPNYKASPKKKKK